MFWLGCAATTHAQNASAVDEDVPVRDRPHPEWAPIGFQAGQFIVYPLLTTTVQANDNILATPSPALADVILSFQPQVTINSDWNQNAVSLVAYSILNRYQTYHSQDANDYLVNANGTLDVRQDLTATGSAGFSQTVLSRTTDAYAPGTATPLVVDQAAATVGVVKLFNRFTLTAQGTFQSPRYSNGVNADGTVENESFRDRNTYIGMLRGDYALSPNLSFFLEETITNNNYDRAAYRDQLAAQTLVGSAFQLTHLMTADIGVGYLSSTFSQSGANPVNNPTARVKVVYFPTQLITVTLTGQQTVVDSGVPTSPAYLSIIAGLEADYELLRNLVITAKVGNVWNDYEAIDRNDRYFSTSLGATYLANRGLTLGLAINHLQHASDGAQAGLPFVQDFVAASVTLQH